MGLHKPKPTSFAADTLRPLVESSLSSGKPLHIIHDVMSVIQPRNGDPTDFEASVSDKGYMRDVARHDRHWQVDMKTKLTSPDLCNRYLDSPDIRFIEETNSRHPGTIINHLGSYPIEASIEISRAFMCVIYAMERGSKKDHKMAIELLMHANDAVACSALLRDVELVRQVSRIGTDVVVLRNVLHGYLTEVDNYEIPVVDGEKTINLAQLYEKHSLTIDGDVEPGELTFGEVAANKLCLGMTDKSEHEWLAVKQLLFLGYMGNHGLWEKENGVEEGIVATNREFEQMVEKTKRKAALSEPRQEL
jgi:hypothetical protein